MTHPEHNRIAPVDPGENADPRLGRYRNPDGSPIALFGIHAHSAVALQHLIRSTTVCLRDATIPVRERELVILRIQARRGAIAEWHTHVEMFAKEAGLGDSDLRRLRESSVAGWKPEDAVLLRLADAMVDGNELDDASWEQLKALRNDAQLVELCVIAAQYLAVAALHAVFEIEKAPRSVE